MQEEVTSYIYMNGQVLVTNKRVVLDRETWPIEAIAEARLRVNHIIAPTRGYMNPKLEGGYALGSTLVAGAILTIAFMSLSHTASPILLALAMLLIISGAGVMAYTAIRNPLEVYKVRLILIGLHGGQHETESMYTWYDKIRAAQTVDAINNALAARRNASYDP
jgi:hypothetical protein